MAEKAVENNREILGTIHVVIDSEKLNTARVRNSVVHDLWTNFKELLSVKQELVKFISKQKSRVLSGFFKDSTQTQHFAESSIRDAENTLRNIDDLITRTHSAAYALSSQEQRDKQQNGMSGYPPSLAIAFEMKKPKDYNIDGGENHDLSAYSRNETIGGGKQYADRESLSNQRLSADYLASLDNVQATLNDLEQVLSEAHRQTRLDTIKRDLIPNLNLALEKNTAVLGLFKDEGFAEGVTGEEILTEDQVSDILSRLEQDRRNIENLRLDAYTVLHGDALRQNVARGASVNW